MSSSLDLGLFIFFNFTNPALFHDFFFFGRGEGSLGIPKPWDWEKGQEFG